MQFFSTGHSGPHDFATFYEAIPIITTGKSAAVCSLLDIKRDTLTRYLTGKTNPPKSMVRLLFHECHYGRSATDAHAHEGYLIERRRAVGLQSEIDQLNATLAALELENDALKRADAYGADVAANASRWCA